MDILLASGNRHKQQEFQAILAPHNIWIPEDRGLEFDCEETGTTYLENALLKAKTLYAQTGQPVLADDSGLSVSALGGAPGIFSARYGLKETGRTLNQQEQNAFLLKKMEGEENRQAFFVCSLVLMIDPYRIYTVQETCPGEIALTPSGKGGFGYDPVFYLKQFNCCLAELSEEEKNGLSHRGKAGRAISKLLTE